MTKQPAIDEQGAQPEGVSPETSSAARRGWWRSRPIRSAAVIFWLMFAINATNYLDRFLAVAVGPTLKAEFHLRDGTIGALSSAFLLVYTLGALPLGLLADRVSRARVVAAGVALWSVASTATAFTRGFMGLAATRAAVGIGEASYYPAGTALLSAYFPLKLRAKVMSRWGAGQLVGIALAFGLTAWLAHWLGASHAWRIAFLISGPPGLLLAALMWFVADTPPGGAAESSTYALAERRGAVGAGTASGGGLALHRVRSVLRIRTVWLVLVLQAAYYVVATPAVTFLPIYLRSPRGPFHLDATHESLLMGVIVVIGGLAGVLLGGSLADWLARRLRGGRVLAAGIGFGVALPCYALMLFSRSLPVFVVAATLTVLALNLQAGPLTAAVQDATPKALRATAVAVTLLLSHMLGDVWSPWVVGSISTALHERTGVALAIVGLPTLALATVVGILGTRFYAAEVKTQPDLSSN
ncbi:MAG: MFS transporter [Ktedonobacterales bacterium]